MKSFNTSKTINLMATVWLSTTVIATRLNAQNIVVNGGFETGNLTGWTLSGSQNYEQVVAAAIYPQWTHSGSYGLDLFGYDVFPTDTVSQTLATTSGQSYTFSFWWESQLVSPNNFEALWNGQSVFSTVNQTGNAWTQEQFTVTATSSSSVLAFASYVSAGNGTYGVDDVSVTAVPEPSTMALAGMGGLGALVATRLRK